MAKHKSQKMKEKICKFPGCGVTFIGKGKAKYCEEHRKAKYRKELYKQNDNNGDAIVRIDHGELYATHITKTCELEGCDNTFDILLVPRVYDYPRYCEEHRNEYKRNLYIQQLKDSDDI